MKKSAQGLFHVYPRGIFIVQKITPIIAYDSAMLITKMRLRIKLLYKDLSAVAPIYPEMIGRIGYVQGVRPARRPPKKIKI